MKAFPHASPFRRLLAGTGAALLAGLVSGGAMAQAYPSKPITLVVPNPPGGFVDASARILSDSLAKVTSQSVVVDNRGGGSGNVAYQYVARANPDGYTLLNSYSAYHVGNLQPHPQAAVGAEGLGAGGADHGGHQRDRRASVDPGEHPG
jgi:tripartite-type tricarboxylate transporter receptor subunit TctC